MNNLTKTYFFDDSITIYQNINGYRFSLDPILLSSQVPQKKTIKSLILEQVVE
ncbi:MAG: hypothetical protein RBR53_07205 [Desulforegulaceae bacterium]|nr:hypothetical protein [Desulforegulaceae bacterium]